MGKKKSSSRAWLKEHHDDVYVQRAQKEGYRSRAVYKLQEINDKDRIIHPGMSVLDLGSHFFCFVVSFRGSRRGTGSLAGTIRSLRSLISS